MKFDFTNFTAKVSELNRLHKSLHDLSDLRWRTQKAEDVARPQVCQRQTNNPEARKTF